MKKNIARCTLLVILIIICIGQTFKLWIGNAPSHNFFAGYLEDNDKTILYPEQIWANSNRHIYKIQGNNIYSGMRYRLVYELINGLRMKQYKIKSKEEISYKMLLASTEGIIYEYGTSMTLSELIGQDIKDNDQLQHKFNKIYMKVDAENKNTVGMYLINEKDEVVHVLEVNNLFFNHCNIMRHYNQIRQDRDLKTYQASILSTNDSEFFKNNIFYPTDNEKLPIYYTRIKFVPILESASDPLVQTYAKSLLKSSNYKFMLQNQDGITFSDNLSTTVKYYNTGTIEFKKTLIKGENKVKASNEVSVMQSFIEECKAIPTKLKKGLYLEGKHYNSKTQETTYLFGYQYNNFKVVLGESVKSFFNITNFLELTVKQNEVIGGKWPLIDIEDLSGIHTQFHQLTEESSTAIDARLEEVASDKISHLKINELECAYLFDEINKVVPFEWYISILKS